MVIRVLLVAVLVLGLMLAIRDGRLTRKLGLISKCQTVATPAGQLGQPQPGETVEFRQCTKGLIDGRRSLKNDGCTVVDEQGKIDVWRCVQTDF